MNIKSADLKSALSRVSSLATGRTTMPVLNCLRLEAKANTLEIAATNLNVYATIKCPCDGDLPAICVPAVPMVGLTDGAAESISLEMDGERLVFKSNGTASLGTIAAATFPETPAEKSENLGLSLCGVADGLDACKWAMDDDTSSEPWKQGVWVRGKANQLNFFASNRTMLAHLKQDLISAECDFQVPAHGMAYAIPALRSDDAILALGDKYLSIIWPMGSVFILRHDCKAPDFNVILNQQRDLVGDVDLNQLRKPFETMKMLANGDLFPMALVSPGMTGIQLDFAGKSNHFSYLFPGVYGGKEFKIDIEKTINAIAHTPREKPVKTSRSIGALFFESGDYTAAIALINNNA